MWLKFFRRHSWRYRSRNVTTALSSAGVLIGACTTPVSAQTVPPAVEFSPAGSAENPPSHSTPAAPVPERIPDEADGPDLDSPSFLRDQLKGPASYPTPTLPAYDPGLRTTNGSAVRPLEVWLESDPLLEMARQTEGAGALTRAIRSAVREHPAFLENEGYAEEALYALAEQRAARVPSAEVNIVGFQVIDRSFAGDSIDNIVERTRADRRFDAFFAANQLVFDFGATNNRIAAARERYRAAALGVDSAAEQVALRTVAAWYEVLALRMVVDLTQAFKTDQARGRQAIGLRIESGASALSDAAILDNSLAQLDLRAARFEQALAAAEARFRELTGTDAPASIVRAPDIGTLPATLEEARRDAEYTAASRAVALQARAAERDAMAAKRDLLPSVGVSLNAGRYGLYESTRDYDVVGRVTLRQRFFGGLPERAKGAGARAAALDFRAQRIVQENVRDAAIAYADYASLNEQVKALETAYIATQKTRNATLARFLASRGTLFDAINAGDLFFSAATAYVQALAQRDTTRFELLARTGRLLNAFDVETYRLDD